MMERNSEFYFCWFVLINHWFGKKVVGEGRFPGLSGAGRMIFPNYAGVDLNRDSFYSSYILATATVGYRPKADVY